MPEQEVSLNYPAQWPPNAGPQNGYIGFPRRFRKTPRAPFLRGRLSGLAPGTCGFSQNSRCCGSQPGPTSGEFPNFPRAPGQNTASWSRFLEMLVQCSWDRAWGLIFNQLLSEKSGKSLH